MLLACHAALENVEMPLVYAGVRRKQRARPGGARRGGAGAAQRATGRASCWAASAPSVALLRCADPLSSTILTGWVLAPPERPRGALAASVDFGIVVAISDELDISKAAAARQYLALHDEMLAVVFSRSSSSAFQLRAPDHR